MDRVTVDDIAAEAGISRATLYRLFPGGKDVLYDALRSRSTNKFFTDLDAHVAAADTLEDLIVSILVESTRALQADEHLQVMLASRPGEVLLNLGFADQPVIIEAATAFLTPRVVSFIGADRSARLAEWLVRVVLSYFFTPSNHVDLADRDSATSFARDFVLPAFEPIPTTTR